MVTRERTNFDIAQSIAPGWERRRALVEETAAPVRDWMLRELAPEPGATLLELAAGAGDVGLTAARRLGERGRLIATDLSPAMLDIARRRGAELGVSNAEYRVVDAERTELPDDSVDGVLCRFGYMLLPDPASALAETHRVLRSGGRVALAVWGPPERNPFFTLVAAALVQHGLVPPPDPAAPGPFALADADRIRALLEDTGFGGIRTEEVPVQFMVSGVEEYLDVTADTGPLGGVLRALSADERAEITTQLAGRLGPVAAAGGYAFPGLALAAVATAERG